MSVAIVFCIGGSKADASFGYTILCIRCADAKATGGEGRFIVGLVGVWARVVFFYGGRFEFEEVRVQWDVRLRKQNMDNLF